MAYPRHKSTDTEIQEAMHPNQSTEHTNLLLRNLSTKEGVLKFCVSNIRDSFGTPWLLAIQVIAVVSILLIVQKPHRKR